MSMEPGVRRGRSINPTRVVLVDPSLFTAPYDAALDGGLRAVGVNTTWAIRGFRPGEQNEFGPGLKTIRFYGPFDRGSFLPTYLRGPAKGLTHVLGLAWLVLKVWASKVDVVHVQWAVLPAIDAVAMRLMRWTSRVVLTVHDPVPYNGDRLSVLQDAAFDAPLQAAQRLIVHTESARQILLQRGLEPNKIVVVPHGPLSINGRVNPARFPRDGRRNIVMFGQIKPYKGLDVLIDALSKVPDAVRQRMRVVVAGAAMMDLGDATNAIHRHGLEATIEIRVGRLDHDEIASLFDFADAFVLPYRQVDASGVFHSIQSAGKWIIASRVGSMGELIVEGESGALVPPADSTALAQALTDFISNSRRQTCAAPSIDWREIAERTVATYYGCQ